MGRNLPEQVSLQEDAIGEQQLKRTQSGAAAEADAIESSSFSLVGSIYSQNFSVLTDVQFLFCVEEVVRRSGSRLEVERAQKLWTNNQ